MDTTISTTDQPSLPTHTLLSEEPVTVMAVSVTFTLVLVIASMYFLHQLRPKRGPMWSKRRDRRSGSGSWKSKRSAVSSASEDASFTTRRSAGVSVASSIGLSARLFKQRDSKSPPPSSLPPATTMKTINAPTPALRDMKIDGSKIFGASKVPDGGESKVAGSIILPKKGSDKSDGSSKGVLASLTLPSSVRQKQVCVIKRTPKKVSEAGGPKIAQKPVCFIKKGWKTTATKLSEPKATYKKVSKMKGSRKSFLRLLLKRDALP